ncbi:helix-turn-helix domain-containing protein [Streptomyces cocklensis]|uniref:DNA-binding transcriptional regulator, PucR family n=1 Tax=Actinacidiphila cocklensis TaxID=887465 RepID=A0A9W4GNK5_9ACTN|nr:helix-turn-helix domain-containing protein [Actinacidiphila cocklensis]MDD1061055.1 helix-turn-helix domain-containing protein [Actinacidiphila cocklensis]CAG6391438.1 DNA-binding transcriptional regulator, PucR family [Actinacidiphila cocklensis]
MLTLDTLISSAPDRLRRAGRVAGEGDRPVAGVWPADPGAVPARERGWRDVLAVLAEPSAPAAQDAEIRALAQAGAAALAVSEPAPQRILDAAGRHRLPVLLTDPETCTVPRLAQLLADLEAAAGRRLQDLLESAKQLSTAPETAAGVLHWLAGAVGGQAVLLAPHRPPPPLGGGLTLPADRVAELTDGRTQAATADVGEWNVRLYALGPVPPHDVLVVARARTAGWPQPVTEAVTMAELLLSSWLRMRAAADGERAPIRSSVLQMLMSGQVLAARRAAHPLGMSPEVLTADHARVYVVGGRAAHRDTLVSACHYHLGDAGLVVGCPVDDHQVIIVATPDAPTEALLRDLVSRRKGFRLGASRTAPLDGLADAHGEATRALAAAGSSPDRYAVFTPDIELVRLLPAAAAGRWAAALLAPLDGWPPARRAEWLDGMRLWLAYGPIGAARLAGFHRNTVRQRAEAVGEALGLDLGRLADRIRLDLALRISRLDLDATGSGRVPGFDELLADAAARRWAEEYLRRLDADLLPTVVTWIEAGQHTPGAAGRLGVHPKTVAARLRRAEAQVREPLISHPGAGGPTAQSANGVCGVHDLALAAHIAGALTL